MNNTSEKLCFNNLKTFKNVKKAQKFFTKNKKMFPMENKEFDALFPCERNDEQQFRTLFTPLAQEEMVKLQKVKNDYSFIKINELNEIYSDSFNSNESFINTDNIKQYYDYEKVRSDFLNFGDTYFKAIYFMFAPILTIPLYQQHKNFDVNKHKNQFLSAFEVEKLVNTSFNADEFSHEHSKTNNILKANLVSRNSNSET
jgi:hypothetical protein